MNHYEMIVRRKSPHLAKGDLKLKVMTALFNDHQSSERAFKSLYQHGYTGGEIYVTQYDRMGDKLFSVQESTEDSGSETICKAVKGTLIGGIFGSVTLGVVLGIILSTWPYSSVLTFLSGMALGFVWGGIIGMLIGPQLPLVHKKKFELALRKDNVLLSFRPKNKEDEAYFKNKNWHTYHLI